MRLLSDIRYAWRLLLKSPGLTAAAISSLALGMGVTTIIFSIASSITKPVSQRNPDGWVRLRIENSGAKPGGLRYADYLELQKQSRSFAEIAFAEFFAFVVAGDGNPELTSALMISPNYFSALGTNPMIGQASNGDPSTVVLSHGYWTRRFAGDPNVIGKKLVSGNPHIPDPLTIIGVARADFHPTLAFLPLRMGADLFIPLQPLGSMRERRIRDSSLLVRLNPGVNLAQAQLETGRLLEHLGAISPISAKSQVSISPVRAELPAAGAVALLLQCLFGLVLLTGCANVANLLLARNEERRTEIALRLALGASRGQLARQLLTESLVLAVAAVPVALALALWCVNVIGSIRLQAGAMELSLDPQVNYRMFGFTLAVSLFAGALSGLLPARAALRADVQSWLKDQSASSGWLHGKRARACLISAQIAVSLVSLTAGAMFLRGLSNLMSSHLGFRPDAVVAGQVLPALGGYQPARTTEFRRSLTERLRGTPGVQSVSMSSGLPLTDAGFSRVDALNPGSSLLPPDPKVSLWYNSIAPHYFPALGIPLLEGRDFTEADLESGSVAIVSRTMAQQFWPGEEPVGKMVRLAGPPVREYRVIGMAADAKYRTMNERPLPFLYLPLDPKLMAFHCVVRIAGRPADHCANLRRVVSDLDSNVPIGWVKPLSDVMQTRLFRLIIAFIAVVALVALLLTAIGLNGMVSHLVNCRRREIGIRMSLGATSSGILGYVLKEGALLISLGLVVGLGASVVLGKLLESQIPDIGRLDFASIGAAGLFLGTVAFFAMYVPARRAAKADPVTALRCD